MGGSFAAGSPLSQPGGMRGPLSRARGRQSGRLPEHGGGSVTVHCLRPDSVADCHRPLLSGPPPGPIAGSALAGHAPPPQWNPWELSLFCRETLKPEPRILMIREQVVAAGSGLVRKGMKHRDAAHEHLSRHPPSARSWVSPSARQRQERERATCREPLPTPVTGRLSTC